METGTPPVGDIEEVFQEDPTPYIDTAVVAVKVSGPVETHAVPSVSGGMRSFTMLATDTPKKISGHDPRRRVVRLISDQSFYVGVDMNSVATNYGARWPANVVCEITHIEELYVRVVADGFVSAVIENWAS